MTLNSVDIAAALRKLFRIKRFASVEFTAKQAFDNLNIAMVFAQVALVITIIILLVGCSAWWRRRRIRRHLNSIIDLLERIGQQTMLLSHDKVIDDRTARELTTARQKALIQLKNYLGSNGIRRVLGSKRLQLLKTTVEQLEAQKISRYEQLELIYHAVTWLSSL